MAGPEHQAAHPPNEHIDVLGLDDMRGRPAPYHVPFGGSARPGITAPHPEPDASGIDRPKPPVQGGLDRPGRRAGEPAELTERFPGARSGQRQPTRPARLPGR